MKQESNPTEQESKLEFYIKKQNQYLENVISTQLKTLQVLTPNWINQLEAMTKPFKQAQELAQSLSKIWTPIMESIQNFDIEGFREFQKEFGWMELITMSYAMELKNKLKEGNKEAVWQKLNSDFGDSEFLNEFIEEMKKKDLFRKRIKIISKALEHHKNRDYISSIPLLLSQTEGIIWDLGIKEGLIENKDNSKILIDKKGNVILDKNNKPIESDLGNLLIKLFGNKSKLKEHASKNVYSKDLRHPILHGRKIDYDNQDTSTMLIIVLFMLMEKTNETTNTNQSN